MEFDWDPAKAAANEQKHAVPFHFATAVFLDARRADFDVSRPIDREPRRKAVGMIESQLFTVVYTPRSGKIRVISARRSNVQEARHYGDR